MNNWILILSLAVALSSLGAFFILYVQYRKMKREKNRSIAEALRKQDRLAKELELARTENKTLERVLSTMTQTLNVEGPASGGGDDKFKPVWF